MKKPTYELTDHVCRGCGGRVLKCVSGGGPTGGGNPIYRCADCGKAAAAMGPDAICWCGMQFRGQHATAYRCVAHAAAKDNPKLEAALRACGCESGRGEVGIALERDVLEALRTPPPSP